MITFDEGLRRLAVATSRRRLLKRAGQALIGVATLTVVGSQRAHAESCPGCFGYTKCNDAACGSTVPNSHSCCSNNPPCKSCGGGIFDQSNCPTGYNVGWHWYCCKSGTLYKCQDCCHPDLGCVTIRFVSGSC